MTSPPRVVCIDDLPLVAGDPPWRPVRQVLGVGAFGVNAYTADTGRLVVEAHDELGAGAGGHEELYVVLRGHARFTVDGREIDAPPGTLVFVSDPASHRVARAEADATVVLVVGGAPGQAFSPSVWEQSNYAAFLARSGEREAALALARDVVDAHPQNPNALYNAACAEALSGDREAALAHLARAVELDAQTAAWAAEDSDLDPVRDAPDFPRAR